MGLVKHVYVKKDGTAKETDNWYYRFQLFGKTYFGSTRSSDPTTAEAIEAQIRNDLVLKNVPVHQNRLNVVYNGKFIEDCEWKRKILNRVKASAKRRGFDFNLTPADLILPTHCPVFGTLLDYSGKTKQLVGESYIPSLDRIDSQAGYVRGNVAVISWRANRIKNDATKDELLQVANYMEHAHVIAQKSLTNYDRQEKCQQRIFLEKIQNYFD
jgi:hypothetical protein